MQSYRVSLSDQECLGWLQWRPKSRWDLGPWAGGQAGDADGVGWTASGLRVLLCGERVWLVVGEVGVVGVGEVG